MIQKQQKQRTWRVVGFSLLLLSLVGCSSSNSNDSSQTDPTDQSTPAAESQASTLDTISAVACSDTPTRMSSDAEMYTAESWTCTFNGEQVRIDMFTGADQMKKAADVTLEFYTSTGDNRTLADLPLVCGQYWTVGVDFNETRDTLITAFNTAGVSASVCD